LIILQSRFEKLLALLGIDSTTLYLGVQSGTFGLSAMAIPSNNNRNIKEKIKPYFPKGFLLLANVCFYEKILI